ncbi:MAG TPA: glycosyltransferase family 2 protein, partial [Fibrobacteria bacterium]|nr:glycosyltransferase family 2 protein [Fibrobacteria bacterium]
MLLSVLLVNYNGKHHLEDCLGTLQAQDFRNFETVMVDNGSSDASVEYVTSQFPWVRVVQSERNLGFAGGNNLGLRHCRGDWVFLLNNDTRLDPGALGAIAEGIRAHPSARVFQAFMIDFHKPDLVDSAGDTLYTSGVPFNYAGFPVSRFREARPITSACGGAAVFERALLERLGGFDEDFFLIFEDVDLSLRARHLGEEIVFLPGAKVYHKGSASLGGKRSPMSFYYSERNQLLLLVKNFPLPTLLRTLP